MIVVVDCETKGLDARNFITACIMKENGKKKHFYKKEDLWEYLIDLGKKEMKRKKVLNVYAHNHEYDFYCYGDLEDEHLEFFSFRPFIASYKVEGKKAINFLDSYAIFKMPLWKVGKMINLPKMELPKEFQNAERITKKRIKELAPYVERDCEIVMEAMKLMKRRMSAEGVNLRRLYTISQIAIAYLINTLKKEKKWERLFFIRKRGLFHKTRYNDFIHGAYRGGRCECFQLGEFDNVDYLDINNLYGYASTQIKFPDINTEQILRKPLEHFKINEIIRNIGVSRVLIHNKTNEIGILPVRTDTGNYYPKEDKYIIGTYTHLELEKAVKDGYEILDIEWSLIWQEMDNPFKTITPRLYKLRKRVDNDFDNFFYKEMQNRSYGKMAQRKSGQEIVTDSVEKAKEYIARGYEIMRGEGYNYMYQKSKPIEDKSYYAPIIPTLINAWARVHMYRQFKKVPKEDLIYTDTDSCIMKTGNLDLFKISKKLGKFKMEFHNRECIVRGRKTYAIGDEIKIAGFRKFGMTQKDFKNGIIKSKRMTTLKTAKDLRDVGGFTEEVRDLNEQLEQNQEIRKMYKEQKVFIDKELGNVNYFVGKLTEIAKN